MISHRIVIAALFSLLTFSVEQAQAQHCKFYEISFKDSLVADNENNILFNTIRLKNPGVKRIRLSVIISIPQNWKSLTRDQYVSGKEIKYELVPGQVKNMSLNLLKQPKTPADWDSVKIAVWVKNVTDTHWHYYHIRAKAEPRMSAQYITEDIDLEKKPDNIPLSFTLKNTGNVADNYTITWQNQYLELEDKLQIRLAPGKDTTVTYYLNIPNEKWHNWYNTNTVLLIKGSGNNSYTHAYRIIKHRSFIKETESAYPVIPLTLEAGGLNQKDRYLYFLGVRGSVHFGENNDLNFFYRSKQLGSEVYGIQQNMYLVDYSYHKWHISAGTIPSVQRFFISNGRGVSTGYRWNEKKEIIVAATLRDPNFYYTSNNFSLLARYPIGNVLCKSTVTANLDNDKALNGYVLSNEMQIIKNSHLSLDVNADAGLEEKTRFVPGIKRETIGGGAGYTFSYKTDQWSFYSNAEYYNNTFPGLNKGLSLQSHQLTYNFNNTFLGAFYSSNHLNTTYFKDTLYNTDVLKYNTEKYGITTGIKDPNNSVGLSFGIMKFTGISEFGLNNLYFADLNYMWKPAKDMYIMINSQNAFKDKVDAKRSNAYITSTLSSFKYKWVGFSAAYTSRPIFGQENFNEVIKSYDETISGGPFLNYHLFKDKLSGLVKYQVSKSVYDQVIRTSLGGNLNYNSVKLGLSMQFYANIPLTNISSGGNKLPYSEERFMNLSVTKQLMVPVVTNRKRYNLELVLYRDGNNNSRKDKAEPAIKKIRVEINDNEVLYTDDEGTIKYRNIEKGTYTLRLFPVEKLGLIPSNGMEQIVSVTGNTTLEIPYKKGKRVTGNIKIIRDSFSTTVYGADNIKITAIDTGGKKFNTFSDNAGNFSFYLPAGIFTVSLNPAAFEGGDFKPDQMSYKADLIRKEEEKIFFTIRQKARKVRFLNTTK